MGEKILSRTGVEESERAKDVSLMRVDLEGNGVVSL